MASVKNVRESNFELLRIVLMLLVLLIHYTPVRIADMTGGIYLTDNIWQDFVNLELKSLSIVCVNCFVLISGYFGIKLKLRSFLSLLFQMVYWSAICVAFAAVASHILAPPLSLSISFFSNIVYGWFPEAYLILFVLSPVLNAFIKSCSEKELGRYIILFYLLSTIVGYLMKFNDFNEGMSLISLAGLYMIGAYLRITTLKIFALKAKYDLMLYLGLGVCMVALSALLIKVGITSSPYGFLNPVVIVMSIYLFLFFKKINIGHSTVINFLSASAFSIYLFHCNPIVFGWICKMWTWINENFGVVSSLLVVFLSFIAIYLFCVVIDRIRILIYSRCILYLAILWEGIRGR